MGWSNHFRLFYPGRPRDSKYTRHHRESPTNLLDSVSRRVLLNFVILVPGLLSHKYRVNARISDGDNFLFYQPYALATILPLYEAELVWEISRLA